MKARDPSSAPEGPAHFLTTHWSRVLAAQGASPQARQALSDLCAAYYQPVIAFLRCQGRAEEEARELAHEFFARMLEGSSLAGADPGRGRFRSYLLGALKHFLSHRRQAGLRLKRGGGMVHTPLPSSSDAPGKPELADAHALPPDMAFDRNWALTLIGRALSNLARESDQAGKAVEYQTLKPWLTPAEAGPGQADAAKKLNISEAAVRVAIHRLRRRFRELIKAEIRQTVSEVSEVETELRYLIQILS